MNRGIWVIAEYKSGELLDVTLQVLGEMKRLSERIGQEVSAVLMGTGKEQFVDTLGWHGAKRVYLVKKGHFESSCSTIRALQLVAMINQFRPRLMVAGATSSTRDYFPRAASLMKAGLVTNCSLFTAKPNGGIQLSKPMYGGKVYANFVIQDADVIMATVRPGTFSMGKPNTLFKAQIIEIEPKPVLGPLPLRRVGHVESDPKTVDISEAELILAGGKGLGNPEDFRRLEVLAELMGAAVGGSRPAVDNEWTTFDRQIGQSGKTVAPMIYIACGISGDNYHILGMKDAKFIIAINKDRKAPFLKIADVGAIADVNDVIREMIEILRQRSCSEGIDP
jgi:electron transfer flavoprotein alpha subunit